MSSQFAVSIPHAVAYKKTTDNNKIISLLSAMLLDCKASETDVLQAFPSLKAYATLEVKRYTMQSQDFRVYFDSVKITDEIYYHVGSYSSKVSKNTFQVDDMVHKLGDTLQMITPVHSVIMCYLHFNNPSIAAEIEGNHSLVEYEDTLAFCHLFERDDHDHMTQEELEAIIAKPRNPTYFCKANPNASEDD